MLALLAACGSRGTATEPSPTSSALDHGGHDDSPASGVSGTPHPSVPEGADGSIDLVTDFAFGGSGVSPAEALAVASSQPVLITGVLLRDAQGGIWFCDELDPAADPPACGSPRLWVTAFPSEQAVFDPANAGTTGMRTEDGVTWVRNQQLFGVVHPAP